MKDEYDLDKMKLRPGKVKVDPEANKIAISVRFGTSDISLVRDEADRLGIPYQTLISSILHRFVTGELVDKKELSIKKPG
jgi:predicted DNA binding CopG/RHH family protein